MLKQRKKKELKWDGSHLGSLPRNAVIDKERVKIGRPIRVCEIRVGAVTSLCLVKKIDSLLPAIFDEIKPIFSLPKIGTHTFRHTGHLMIALKPQMKNEKICPELTLNLFDPYSDKTIIDQIQLNLAFREVFGISDTHNKSLIVRYNNGSEIPSVISFLEPGTVAGKEDALSTVIPATLLKRWFHNKSLERAVADLFCLNRDCPEASLGYYRPLIEDVILRIDPSLITYISLFFDRLTSFLPY